MLTKLDIMQFNEINKGEQIIYNSESSVWNMKADRKTELHILLQKRASSQKN